MQRHENVTGMSDGSAEDTQVIEIGDGAGAEPSGNRHWPWIAALVSGAVLLVLAVVYLVDLFASSGQIERRTTIAGVPVGGMTPDEAAAALSAAAVPLYGHVMTVDVHGEPVSVDPAAAGLSP